MPHCVPYFSFGIWKFSDYEGSDYTGYTNCIQGGIHSKLGTLKWRKIHWWLKCFTIEMLICEMFIAPLYEKEQVLRGNIQCQIKRILCSNQVNIISSRASYKPRFSRIFNKHIFHSIKIYKNNHLFISTIYCLL